MIRVLIVAEDPYVRTGLNAMLDFEEEIEICGQISLEQYRRSSLEMYSPDVILLDAQDPIGLDPIFGEELEASEWPILVLGLDPGASSRNWPSNISMLISRVNTEQLRAAIHAIAAGLQVFDGKTEREGRLSTFPLQIEILEPLTDREIEVLLKLAEGLTNRAIAHALGISENTVKFHVNGIFKKLQAQSRTEAVVQAVRAGLLPL